MTFAGFSTAYLIGAAVVVVLVVALIVFLLRRARPTRPQVLPSQAAAPTSPTAVICQFCRREYEPSETGGRCPGCGAATPRKG